MVCFCFLLGVERSLLLLLLCGELWLRGKHKRRKLGVKVSLFFFQWGGRRSRKGAAWVWWKRTGHRVDTLWCSPLWEISLGLENPFWLALLKFPCSLMPRAVEPRENVDHLIRLQDGHPEWSNPFYLVCVLSSLADSRQETNSNDVLQEGAVAVMCFYQDKTERIGQYKSLRSFSLVELNRIRLEELGI